MRKTGTFVRLFTAIIHIVSTLARENPEVKNFSLASFVARNLK
jgi:hypothetical protein